MWKLPLRTKGTEGSLEDHLPGIQTSLVRTLAKAQDNLTHETLKLTRPQLKTLAAILVEFAVDLHCAVGIWLGLERYHREFFGTSLPMIPESEVDRPSGEISADRVRHLLWVLYPRMIPDLIIAPEHVDLLRVADVVAGSLREQFANLPRESEIKKVLATSDEYGWDVKRKLIWLGKQSYLFRLFIERYAQGQDAKPTDISVIDDFLCQECTEWAGLGVPEILAGVLELPPERRADLLSWSQRHNAMYKVLSGTKERIEVLNVINDRKYRIRMNLERNPFPRGSFVHGSLVPWGGEWYWSGAQKTFERLDGAMIARLKQDYRKLPAIYYRYSPEDLKKARGLVRQQHDEFVTRHGKDWVAYPDGLAMAADWQKTARERIASLSPGDRKRLMEKHGLKTPSTQINLPTDLLESKRGIGVYFNPEEGMEIIQNFDDLLSGLRKRGKDLIRGEEEAIREWIRSGSISPGFVRRLVAEYGVESIKAAFLLGRHEEGYVLEYLMRRYKGRFYRPRYPTLTLVE